MYFHPQNGCSHLDRSLSELSHCLVLVCVCVCVWSVFDNWLPYRHTLTNTTHTHWQAWFWFSVNWLSEPLERCVCVCVCVSQNGLLMNVFVPLCFWMSTCALYLNLSYLSFILLSSLTMSDFSSTVCGTTKINHLPEGLLCWM